MSLFSVVEEIVAPVLVVNHKLWINRFQIWSLLVILTLRKLFNYNDSVPAIYGIRPVAITGVLVSEKRYLNILFLIFFLQKITDQGYVTLHIGHAWIILYHFFVILDLLSVEVMFVCVQKVHGSVGVEKVWFPAETKDHVKEIPPIVTQSRLHNKLHVFIMTICAQENEFSLVTHFLEYFSKFRLSNYVLLWIFEKFREEIAVGFCWDNCTIFLDMDVLAVDCSSHINRKILISLTDNFS